MGFRFAAIIIIIAAAALAGCQDNHRDITKDLVSRPQARPKPDPSKVYAVGVAGAPSIGPVIAPLTVVIAYEYACPWCNRERMAFEAVRAAYGDDVRFVFQPFVVHDEAAGNAALAACAAERQGRFAEVNEALWTDVFEKSAYDRASVERAASRVAGIDLAKLRTDMDGDCASWVATERAALSDLGVNGTPQLWVNGRPLSAGYKPLEAMKSLLDEELARARERIAAGTPPAAYYTDWVMKKGMPKLEVASK